MRLPSFITFTGIDDATDLGAARALAEQYPVEFGVLFSPSRQGVEPRYPSWPAIYKLLAFATPGMRFAAHLCGGHSRQLLASASTSLDDLLREHFGRVQVNTTQQGIDAAAIDAWGNSVNAEVILQCRESFPVEESVSWLFDASGGQGIEPKAWPAAPIEADRQFPPLFGYAGGLKAENIATALPLIATAAGFAPYWIDMESGVRDEHDRFSIEKCRAVCEAVYGAPA